MNIFSHLDLQNIRIVNNFQTKALHHLPLKSKSVFHVSILAHDSAQIIFTQDNGYATNKTYDGYMAMLGGWLNKTIPNYSQSVIRYCPEVKDNYPQHCDNITSKVMTRQIESTLKKAFLFYRYTASSCSKVAKGGYMRL